MEESRESTGFFLGVCHRRLRTTRPHCAVGCFVVCVHESFSTTCRTSIREGESQGKRSWKERGVCTSRVFYSCSEGLPFACIVRRRPRCPLGWEDDAFFSAAMPLRSCCLRLKVSRSSAVVTKKSEKHTVRGTSCVFLIL